MRDSTLAADKSVIPSPKTTSALDGRASWYPYYAGYSREFVRHILEDLGTARSGTPKTVLDPWNGCGTTTEVAADMGFDAIGVDLNPVMVTVARARALRPDDVHSVRELSDTLSRLLDRTETFSPPDDQLSTWFADGAVTGIRSIEAAIREQHPVEPWSAPFNASVATACFFWTALFRCVRRFLAPLRGTNPTWVRRPLRTGRIDVHAEEVRNTFREELAAMTTALASEDPIINAGCLSVVAASSTALPLEDGSVDVIVTSPPYCTRIDYAVTTSVELAVLRIGTLAGLRDVRNRMIGTTTIRANQPNVNGEWGATCLELLDAIRNHDSRASISYYLKTHLQYFDDVFSSLLELNRCLRAASECIIVVQDSYYKDIRNDLPTIVQEMGESIGWLVEERNDFPVTRSMAGINGRAKRYMETRSAVESVLKFRKV